MDSKKELTNNKNDEGNVSESASGNVLENVSGGVSGHVLEQSQESLSADSNFGSTPFTTVGEQKIPKRYMISLSVLVVLEVLADLFLMEMFRTALNVKEQPGNGSVAGLPMIMTLLFSPVWGSILIGSCVMSIRALTQMRGAQGNGTKYVPWVRVLSVVALVGAGIGLVLAMGAILTLFV